MNLLVTMLFAACLPVLAHPLGQRLGRHAGWVLSAGLAGLAVLVTTTWLGTRTPIAGVWPWLPQLDVAFRLRMDGLSLVFCLVVLVIGALVMAYAVSYLPAGRHGSFYALLAFFAASMIGLVLADDLVLMWVMWEFTTICSFLLIQQTGPKGKAPALRTLLVTGGGGLCLLGAVALTVTATGTTHLSAALTSPVWRDQPGTSTAVAVLVALAAFTKGAQFPFHGWLPDAMVASTPVSAYLHAAAMVKAAMYLLLRFSTALHAVPLWNMLLVGVGLLTMVMGAVYALQRHDLKELLAYSTISQLGMLVATIGVGTGYAMVAALTHVIAHAIFKSSLFMSVGLIDHETTTRDIRRLSGLRRHMPWSSLALVLGAASMAGLPPLLGFVSKEAVFKGFTEAPFGDATTLVVCVVAVAGAMCTMAYSGRMLRPLFGPDMEEPPHEAPVAMIAPVLVGAVAGVLLGLTGPVLQPLVDTGARAVLADSPAADLTLWHGLNAALVMSLTAIGLGAALIVARERVDRLVVGRTLGVGNSVAGVEGFRSGSIALGRRVGDLTRSDNPYRALLAPLLVLVLGVGGVVLLTGVPGLPPAGHPFDWLLLAVVVGGVAFTLGARSRVALVTIVGIVGFAMALLFFVLGAPDVAVTQLLVEILTVVVMVLLLVRMPDGFHPTGALRSGVAVTVALAAGVAGTLIALFVMTPRSGDALGDAFLARAYELTAGTNVVNTILVDFRALDTYGEMVALGTAAVAFVVALRSRGLLPLRPSPLVVSRDNPAHDPHENTTAIRVLDRVVAPLLIGLSLWFFLRGHYETGGGFIGALVAGAAVVLVFLASGSDWITRLHIDYLRVIGVGIVVATVTGLVNLVWAGSFLTPMTTKVAGVTLSTGLVFDIGVYLTVLGLVLGSISELGLDTPEPTPLRRPGRLTTREERDR